MQSNETTPEEAAPENEREAGAEQQVESAPSGEESPAVATSPLSRAIAALQDAQRNTHDRLLRTAADFDNFKKRSRRETSESVKRAEEKIVLSFLPVMDNLERAIAHAASDAGTLLEGVQMVQKQFLTTLERLEVMPFESQGVPFDPERHEALQQMPSELPVGTVCLVMQTGYIRGERLVRPALVAVSSGPSAPAPASGTAAGSSPADDPSAADPAAGGEVAPVSGAGDDDGTRS